MPMPHASTMTLFRSISGMFTLIVIALTVTLILLADSIFKFLSIRVAFVRGSIFIPFYFLAPPFCFLFTTSFFNCRRHFHMFFLGLHLLLPQSSTFFNQLGYFFSSLPLFSDNYSQFSPIKSLIMANAASGMAVHDDCKLKFMELKTKRTYRYIIYKIEEKQKQVIVEKLGETSEAYDEFAACLPADECRYAVFDYDFMTVENVPKSRIFFVAWSPDTARVRTKMIYASSKDRFKRELDGIQIELQATDSSEIGLDVFKGRAN